MRHGFSILLIISHFFSLAQAPEGKLYMITGTGGVTPPVFSFIEYPGETYTVIDTVQLSDFCVHGDKLLAAAYLDLLIYDTVSYHAFDTIKNVYARSIASWGNNVAMTSIAPPYFRVYDVQSHNLLFAVDTTELPQIPGDLAIADDKAFLLLDDSVVVVDLLLQGMDTIVATPHPFGFAGYNYYIVEAGNDFYITVEYVTGAIRSSLMRLNKSTYAVDTVFHLEGYGNSYRPVVAGDKIYLLAFDTYYDITDDSLYLSANQWQPIPMDYDEVSGALFLHHPPSGMNYFINGSFSDTVICGQNVMKALFVPDSALSVNSLKKEEKEVKVYPNPVQNILMVELPQGMNIESVEVLDFSGRKMKSKPQFISGKITVEVSGLLPGFYLLRIITDKGNFIAKFIR